MGSPREAVGARAPVLLVWVAASGVALGSPRVLPWLSLGDCALALVVVAAAAYLWRRRQRPVVGSWAGWLGLFVAVSLLLGLWLWLADGAGFDGREFLRSFVKLLFYGCSAVVVATLARAAGGERTAKAVAGSFTISGAIAIALYLAAVAGTGLPARVSALAGHWPGAAAYSEKAWFEETGSDRSFVRAMGLAAEPAELGFLQAMAFGFLLLRRQPRPSLGVAHGVIALSALISFSLAAYAVLLVAVALWLPRLVRASGARLRRRAGLVAAICLVVGVLPPVGPTLHGVVIRRVARIVAEGPDASTWLRTVGSWVIAGKLLAAHPFTGVGLGNYEPAAESVRPEIPLAAAQTGRIASWSVLAYVLATTGPLGLAAFAAVLLAALRGTGALAPLFIVGTLVQGTLLGPAFWVFLALFASDSS